MTQVDPIPILLITDPGRDIDDVLALLALVDAQQTEKTVKIVGIVCSGHNSYHRARIVTGWIQILCPAIQCPITYTSDKTSSNVDLADAVGVYVHSTFANVKLVENNPLSAAQLIVDMCIKYAKKLHILAIAPLTPLAQALQLDTSSVCGVGKLWIQGQATVHSNNNCVLVPDFAAFNLSEDKDAAESVFEIMQPHVPFQLLGKHAAYQVTLYKKDLFNKQVQSTTNLAKAATRLEQEVLGSMDIFRLGNPTLFQRLYKVDPSLDDWYSHTTAICKPYDPLLLLSMLEPHLFDPIIVSTNTTSSIKHCLIGMDEQHHGLKNADLVHDALVRRILGSYSLFAATLVG